MEQSKSRDCMDNIIGQLEVVFLDAIKSACPGLQSPPVAITPSTKEAFGDYQCNSAMNLAQVCFYL